jgi:hypothetical protein
MLPLIFEADADLAGGLDRQGIQIFLCERECAVM